MQIYMWGTMEFDKPVPEDLRETILGWYKDSIWGSFLFDKDGTELTLDYSNGDFGEDINHIADFLKEHGISVDPENSSFPYTGDYDGGYLWEDGKFHDFDQEEFILRTLPTETLMDELNRRNLRSNLQQN